MKPGLSTCHHPKTNLRQHTEPKIASSCDLSSEICHHINKVDTIIPFRSQGGKRSRKKGGKNINNDENEKQLSING